MAGYDTTVRCDSFAGLYQGGDGYNIDLKYAVDGKNFDVQDGTLTPKTAPKVILELPGGVGADAVRTLMAFTKRYTVTEGAVEPDGTTYIVCIAGGKLYTRSMTDDTWTLRYTGFTNNSFDYVTYEVNSRNGNPTEAPVDVLLFTNSTDGMYCLYADDMSVDPVTIQPTGTNEPIKFGMICRHAERIWGGAIDTDPDKLMYSAPYNPFDWEQDNDNPENGAGDILQPSWDGDRFIALRTYGSYLLAIKKGRIWRILGTNPAEYTMKEQYGGGAIVENTVGVHGDMVLMMGYDGLMYYMGSNVMSFRHPYLRTIMDRVNRDALQNAVSCVAGDVYYLALPVDGSDTNNLLLEYSFADGAFTAREGVNIASMLYWDGILYCLTADEPGALCTLGHGEGSGTPLPMAYISAKQTLGAPNVKKSAFEVYLTSPTGMTVTVSIGTEKKEKSKTVELVPGKTKRVNITANGRTFQIKLETKGGKWWNLAGGYSVHMELDYD